MAELIYKFITDAGIKQINENERSLIAWASRSSIDRDDEEIDANGWITKDYRKNPVVPLFHDYGNFPIAKSAWEKPDPKDNPIGLLFKPIFADTMLGQEAFYLYKEGYMNAFSIGFDPMEWMDSDGELHSKEKDGEFSIWQKGFIEQKKKKPRCRFLKQMLLEISGVLVPAHPDALVETRSHIKTPELSKYIDEMINKSRKPMITVEKDMATPDQISKIWEKSLEVQDILKEVGAGYVCVTPTFIDISQYDTELEMMNSRALKIMKTKDDTVIDSQDYDGIVIDDDDFDLDIEVEVDALGGTGDISDLVVEISGDAGDVASIEIEL